MTTIIDLQDIKQNLSDIDVVDAMREGFVQYSNQKTVVPPVAELLFDNPPGDVHIKYGYIKDDAYYTIKIASGFYNNPKIGIPSSQGMMLLFNQKTGQPVAVLLDEGYLTDIRTAAAGALAARYFAPKQLTTIGIIGTGIQADLQLQYLIEDNPNTEVWIWGRNPEKVKTFMDKWNDRTTIHAGKSPKEVAQYANLIVTTTPSEIPLLKAEDIQPGTHITAVGSDTSDKQELDGEILKKADLVIADSIPQSQSRGEIYKATTQSGLPLDKVVELGKAIQDASLCRINDQQISVVDLTGVAVQDIMISTAVYNGYINKNR